MIVRLELTKVQAEALRLDVDERMSELVAISEPDDLDLALFVALRNLRTQLGGKNESVKSTGGTLRSARRVP
jgi:hypothetical protein